MSNGKSSTNMIDFLKRFTSKDLARPLGDITWWSLSGGEISRDDLTRIWTGAGLSPTHLPEPPSPERAFRTSVREAQVGQEKLLRFALESDDRIIVGVVAEHRDGSGGLDYRQEASVLFDRHSKAISASGPDLPLVHRIRERYQVLKSAHTLDDVRRALTKTLDSLAAVQLRSHGGVVWVPGPNAQPLRMLQTAIEQIGSSRVYLLPITDTPEGQATLSEIARGSLEDDLAVLRLEIEGFLQQPPEREGTLLRRLESFEALRSRAGLFTSVLRVQTQDLEQQIRQLEGTVGQMVEARTPKAA
jgi:hypothetical protein